MVEEHNAELRKEGKSDECVDLPQLDECWLFRWRKFYGIAAKARNICYKISRAKLKHRLGVFWRNTIRFRYLWILLNGGEEPKFASGDQKPNYFNANGEVLVLSIKGFGKVEAIDNHAATRQRFSSMSLCLSYIDEVTKNMAALS